MHGKVILNNENAIQGIYQPSSIEDARKLFDEASELALDTMQKISDAISPELQNAGDDRTRVIRHYAHLIALGALADVHVSFQSADVQRTLTDLRRQYANSLRQFLFDKGVRDADVLAEKLGAEAS